MRVYAYLRASTSEQNADRARKDLITFSQNHDFTISGWFTENVSGATLKRPALFKLLELADQGDVLLVEQVDRISRLNEKDWSNLKSIIADKGIRIVSLDLPTSHSMLNNTDEFTDRMFTAINKMMLDMLAAVARKDYIDRRKRQQQGIDRAKRAGLYKGRRVDNDLRDKIKGLLLLGKSYNEIVKNLKCSRGTISSVSKTINR
jgi:DNA invertase Pin-like site-specific DNA recombinase